MLITIQNWVTARRICRQHCQNNWGFLTILVGWSIIWKSWWVPFRLPDHWWRYDGAYCRLPVNTPVIFRSPYGSNKVCCREEAGESVEIQQNGLEIYYSREWAIYHHSSSPLAFVSLSLCFSFPSGGFIRWSRNGGVIREWIVSVSNLTNRNCLSRMLRAILKAEMEFRFSPVHSMLYLKLVEDKNNLK